MLEILKYTLPALIVFACTWTILYMMIKNERERRDLDLRKASQKEFTAVRLRSYERLALLLDRTVPEHILRDIDVTNLTVKQLQILLLKTVRTEFDHNLSQQIYVSNELWDSIKLVENELGRFITVGAAAFPPNGPALPYAQQLITMYNTNGVTPTQMAQEKLRDEARLLLRN